jgi:hypothetical protein
VTTQSVMQQSLLQVFNLQVRDNVVVLSACMTPFAHSHAVHWCVCAHTVLLRATPQSPRSRNIRADTGAECARVGDVGQRHQARAAVVQLRRVCLRANDLMRSAVIVIRFSETATSVMLTRVVFTVLASHNVVHELPIVD